MAPHLLLRGVSERVRRTNYEMGSGPVAQTEMKRQQELTEAPPIEEHDRYAPRKYSARESATMAAKMIGIFGLLIGLLWLLDVWVAR